MLNANTIGDKIAAARKNIFLSQADLAQKISISPQAVGKWERGESMPDITTLNRLAEILGVDLNYFSENFQSQVTINPTLDSGKTENSKTSKSKEISNRDMSKLNLADSDFSGLKNLSQNFSSANMQRCLFIGSNLSGLTLNKNNVDGCDFTDSDISKSQIQSSNLQKNKFHNCSLSETVITKSNILNCDFSGADFTGTVFKSGNFMKNTLWKTFNEIPQNS
ncbi:MAG: helix-turn-helix domain-containing protein [Bacteroidetes bacterium]|nr:helix-turn-helix domain-containing protein [Bacteroidota bacterium]